MTIELTSEEKAGIINQHIKSVAYSEYNAILSLAEANALSTPNASTVESLTAQLADVRAQKAVLQTELDALDI